MQASGPSCGIPAGQAHCPAVRIPPPDDTGGQPDEALMLAFAGGDAAAFDALYARHKGGVYRYFLRSLREPALAEELHQEVWMAVIDKRQAYLPQAKFTTYLYTVAHNRLIDHVRRAGKMGFETLDGDDNADGMDGRAAAFEPSAPPTADPAVRVESRHKAQRFLAALDTLPAVQREAFLLQQEADLSVEEIAAATGTAAETAKSRLRYAMNKLRAAMKDWQ
jgi:RNA polymerase sigma factor (sigma-70 family)